jgi:hypothetical protein
MSAVIRYDHDGTTTVHDPALCHCRLRDGQMYKRFYIQHIAEGRWQATAPIRHYHADGTYHDSYMAFPGDGTRSLLRSTSKALRHRIDEAEAIAAYYEMRMARSEPTGDI